MSRDDDLRFEPRLGRSRGRGDGRARRPLTFLQEVNRAVARAGGDPRRLGRARSTTPRTGRFNARGRGAKLAASFPREHGWSLTEGGMRFRACRVVVKARVVKLRGAGSKASYAYDGFDRLAKTTWPDSNADTETYTYDADGNVLTRKTRRGDTIGFAYDTLNRVCTKTYATIPVACGGTSANYLASYAYDLDGRLIGANDNSAAFAAPPAGTASYATTYTYDALNRPLSATWNPAPAPTPPSGPSSSSFAFGYDPTNRRISQTGDKSWWAYPTTAASTAYTANTLNQYSAVGAVSPTYDGDGNLTCDGSYLYAYDAESRLTNVSTLATAGNCSSTPTTTVATYAYDAQGRRKSKTVSGTTTVYTTDADNREVLEYNGTSGVVGNWYAYGLGPNDVLNQMNGAGTDRQTLILDVQGSIIGSLDAASGALTKTGYQPFGENPSLTSGTFQYTAARFDPESGFYYMRSRMYRTDWGRFSQPDPIGYAGGTNLYAYVGNDPLNNTDPSGLAKVEILYRPIPATLDIASHSYVVVSESDGSNPMVFRAGPGNTGTIYAQSEPYGPNGIDYTPSPRAGIVVINDNLPAAYYENQLTSFESTINAAAIPYSPLSTNSNAYAAQAIESLGVVRPQAPTLAPGYSTVLPTTPNPASGLTPSTGPGFSNPSFSTVGSSSSPTSSTPDSAIQSGSSPSSQAAK